MIFRLGLSHKPALESCNFSFLAELDTIEGATTLGCNASGWEQIYFFSCWLVFTKVPCNKCEQVTAAGWPLATLPASFFLQLPLTSYLKKEGSCCAAVSFLRSTTAQKQQWEALWKEAPVDFQTTHHKKGERAENENPASMARKAVKSPLTDTAFSNDSLFPCSAGGSMWR